MNKKIGLLGNNKGTLLMHTVVLSVVMAMMGTMLLKWATNRYETVSKSRRQLKATMLAQSCLAQRMVGWSDNPPLSATGADMSCVVDADTGLGVDMKLSTYEIISESGVTTFGIIVSVTQNIL